jgi:Na+/H+-dicarboxylate symporter
MFRSATNITGHVAAAVTVEGLCGEDLESGSLAPDTQ